MTLSITDAILSTQIFTVIFLLFVLASVKARKDNQIFPLATTHELKGLAILMVVFSHIGYFLTSDHQFLFPLSIAAGVGVNLFLFLSGYGLAVSNQHKPQTIGQFYGRRLIRLLLPVWIVLTIFFLLDYFILHLAYGSQYIAQSFLGYFPTADLYHDIDSPLWYFTLILFYYLIFPIFYSRRRPWLSAAIIYLLSYFIILWQPPALQNVLGLYKVHFAAFPLGIAFAWLLSKPDWFKLSWLKKMLWRFKKPSLDKLIVKSFGYAGYYALFAVLLAVTAYTAYYSNIGGGMFKEQLTSLITMSAIVLLFLIKKFEFKLFALFGTFSYEIYLLHWPAMSRYNIFFTLLPSWLAVTLYLAIFLALGWLLHRLTGWALRKVMPKARA
ncbi:MAG: acyltransferase [Patescibacteria group bacterium]|jgi:peptidoglycan/LPS O-acetylase OafA/YrhL